MEKSILPHPPRLLLGAAALFWGASHGRPAIGLLVAFVLECPNWLQVRWKTSPGLHHRLAQVIFAALLVIILSARLETDPAEAILSITRWLPIFLLPLILAERFGSCGATPTSALSQVLSFRLRNPSSSTISLGYPYFFLFLLTGGLNPTSSLFYGLGVLTLVFSALFFTARQGRERPTAWAFASLLTTLSALSIAATLFFIYEYLFQGGWRSEIDQGLPTESTTYLGRINEIKQSHTLRWRLRVLEGAAPDLLPLASYNTFGNNNWLALPEVPLDDSSDPTHSFRDRDFSPLFSAPPEAATPQLFAFEESALDEQNPPQLALRGRLENLDLLPLPYRVQTIQNLPAQALEANPLGSVRAVSPATAIVDFQTHSAETDLDTPPGRSDLALGGRRLTDRRALINHALESFWTESETTLRPDPPFDSPPPPSPPVSETIARIETLQKRFQTDFSYSLSTRTPSPKARRLPAVAAFLSDTRQGHCEYFATAGTLLLRRAGIPARYVVGYSVQEQNGPDEYYIRGIHAHAWVRAYLGGTWTLQEGLWRCLGGQWVTLDFTPSSWVQAHPPKITLTRRVAEAWQLFTEDFALWRSRLALNPPLLWMAGLLSAAVAIFLFRRLFQTSLKAESQTLLSRTPAGQTLKALEQKLAALTEPRPPHQPLASWLISLQKHPTLQELPLKELAKTYQTAAFSPQESHLQGLRKSIAKVDSALPQDRGSKLPITSPNKNKDPVTKVTPS